MLKLLWDDKRQFFFSGLQERRGTRRIPASIKAVTKTYEDGQFAGRSRRPRVDRLCAVAVQHARSRQGTKPLVEA